MRYGRLLAGAAGIAVTLLVGCEPQEVNPPSTSTTTTAAVSEVGDTLVVHVPEMHCPFACWPAVEETLAAQPGVIDVKLAPQKDEDAIDNPKVYVRVSETFDADAAVESLATAGFKGSDVAAAN